MSDEHTARHEEPTLDRDALMDALAQDAQVGSLVPFLGAGVSLTARLPGDNSFQPSVEWISRQVWNGLDHSKLDGSGLVDAVVSGLHPEPFQATKLDQLAEVAAWNDGRAAVVESVGMGVFTELVPTTAHRTIARMAREGWVSEVITTNYDTCLEKAYQGTFRHQRRSAEGERCPAVITTDGEYRRLGRPDHLDGRGADGPPVLRLYKINGCAQAWVNAAKAWRSDPTSCELRSQLSACCDRILLSDPQLAALDSPWKLDLLRDRMRSRRLVYSGFGGQEGQIRYTHLAVDGEGRESQPNATAVYHGPVVHVFEPEPNFFQLQLLAQTRRRPDTRGLVTPRCNWAGHPSQDPPSRLTADDFWRDLYRYAITRAVQLHLEHAGGAFRSALGRVGRPIGVAAVEPLLDWLIKECRANATPWRPFDEVNVPLNQGRRSLCLHAILAAARGYAVPDPNRDPPSEFYRPFADDPVALCTLLSLMARWPDPSDIDRSLACDHALMPVWYRGCAWRALLVDSDQVRQSRWRLRDIREADLPTIAVDLGQRPSRTVPIEVVLGSCGGPTRRVSRGLPCIPATDLLTMDHPNQI